ncbi:MAG: TPM domain-containing protein, partial [Oscillospiraceae bacterium]|nr:TPM domain-containing protein [Oscillospiraceae bacterium]
MEFFKKRSTAWAVLLAVIVCSFFIGQAKRPKPEIEILPSGVYVQDNANVLSDSTEKYITQMNNGLVSRANAEIQVATVDTTGGEDIFDVAIDLAIETNLSPNCCVFLVAVDDIDAVIVQGEALIHDFSDAELSAILQENFTVEDFEDRDVDYAVRASFDDLISMYENYYGINVTGSRYVEYEDVGYNSSGTVLMMVMFIVLLIVAVSLITRPRRRTVVTPFGTGRVGTPPPRTGYYPPRGSYRTPPPYSGSRNTRSSGFGTANRGGSFSSTTRSGGFGTSSRGGSFSSGRSSFSGGRSSIGSSSRSGGFGGSCRG